MDVMYTSVCLYAQYVEWESILNVFFELGRMMVMWSLWTAQYDEDFYNLNHGDYTHSRLASTGDSDSGLTEKIKFLQFKPSLTSLAYI